VHKDMLLFMLHTVIGLNF